MRQMNQLTVCSSLRLTAAGPVNSRKRFDSRQIPRHPPVAALTREV